MFTKTASKYGKESKNRKKKNQTNKTKQKKKNKTKQNKNKKIKHTIFWNLKTIDPSNFEVNQIEGAKIIFKRAFQASSVPTVPTNIDPRQGLLFLLWFQRRMILSA